MLKSMCKMMLATSMVIGLSANAQEMKGTDMKGMHDMHAPAGEKAEATGVIKAIDKAAGKVTIAHEPVKAFGWPSMTMGFKVADLKLLDGVAVGKKVQFTMQGKDMMKTQITAMKVVP